MSECCSHNTAINADLYHVHVQPPEYIRCTGSVTYNVAVELKLFRNKRDISVVTLTTQNTFLDVTLASGYMYTVSVSAVNSQNMSSIPSNPLDIDTQPAHDSSGMQKQACNMAYFRKKFK